MAGKCSFEVRDHNLGSSLRCQHSYAPNTGVRIILGLLTCADRHSDTISPCFEDLHSSPSLGASSSAEADVEIVDRCGDTAPSCNTLRGTVNTCELLCCVAMLQGTDT